jgi:hypothetical protein
MLLTVAMLMLGQAGEPVIPTSGELGIVASKDLARYPPEIQEETRYLRQPPDMDDKAWSKFCQVMALHVNGLSWRGKIYHPAPVGKHMLRIQMSHYGWARDVWEKLADPYSTIPVKAAEERYEYVAGDPGHWQKNKRNSDQIDHLDGTKHLGAWFTAEGAYYKIVGPDWVKARGKDIKYPPGRFRSEVRAVGKEQIAIAPWLAETEAQKEAITYLSTYTKSVVPVVRADWFLEQTAAVRYYEFNGIKNQADFEKLVRFDKKLAFELERKKVVSWSGVAKGHVRRIERTQTTLGALWRTFDSEKPTGRKNALVFLDDEEFEFEATEQIGTRPNGLPAFFLGSNVGASQQVAPGNIVGGYRRRGIGHNDSELQINTSCWDCHTRGKTDNILLAIEAAEIKKLSAYYDYKIIDDLARQYVNAVGARDIPRLFISDRQSFAAAVFEASGMMPFEFGEAYLKAFGDYTDKRVDIRTAAYDAGVSVKELKICLDLEEKTVGYVHPTVSNLQGGKQVNIRQYEEVIPIIQEIRHKHSRRKAS